MKRVTVVQQVLWAHLERKAQWGILAYREVQVKLVRKAHWVHQVREEQQGTEDQRAEGAPEVQTVLWESQGQKA